MCQWIATSPLCSQAKMHDFVNNAGLLTFQTWISVSHESCIEREVAPTPKHPKGRAHTCKPPLESARGNYGTDCPLPLPGNQLRSAQSDIHVEVGYP